MGEYPFFAAIERALAAGRILLHNPAPHAMSDKAE
jgi:hypothetical protein